MYGHPNKGQPGYYMVDSRYAHRAYYEFAEQQARYPQMGGYIPATAYPQHPNSHHPYMPWGGDSMAVPAVFVPTGHPGQPQYHGHPRNSVDDRAESVASSSGSSSSGSGKKPSSRGQNGRKSPQVKYGANMNKRSSIQLAEIEEMAQQADRMRISDRRDSTQMRERRNSNDSSEGSSNDSGHYNEEGDYEIPTQECSEKIIDQVEYYLSDEYLAKDKYLLRQIRCKSEGYISIKLMTSFKKVKKLTRDWQVVRHALKLAPQLEVSPEGYRVKRRDILPELLRKPRLLTSVVAIRVPPDFDSVDKITSLFRSYGEIGLVRLLRPGKEVPSDLRNYATQVPDIGDSLCAVVDFEGSEAALKAVRELKEQFSDSGMRLALLGPRMRRTLYRQDRLAAQGKLGSEDGSESICDDKSVASGDTSEISGHSCKDSGHGDGLSEISDDNSGKLSPEPVDEKKKHRGLSGQVREPMGPTNGEARGFGISRQISQ